MSEKAKIRRGATPRHTRPVTQPRRGNQPRPIRVPAAVDARRPLGRALRWASAAVLVLVLGAGLVAAGVPQMAGRAVGEGLGAAGFVVKRVEITGLHHMDRLTVYSAALDQAETAMPMVDLDAIRQRLLRYGWVEDARVSRRLPDTLLVDIVERRPAAIWQYRGRLTLIDRNGVQLAPVPVAAMPDLPLVIGPDANRQTAQLETLMDAAPSLKPMLTGGSWIGGRRWDILFQSGETLALPEGDAEARAAIAKFAKMDQVASLLGRGFRRFDMRIPGRFYARTDGGPGSVAAPIVPATPPAAVAGPPQPDTPAHLPKPPANATAKPDAA